MLYAGIHVTLSCILKDLTVFDEKIFIRDDCFAAMNASLTVYTVQSRVFSQAHSSLQRGAPIKRAAAGKNRSGFAAFLRWT